MYCVVRYKICFVSFLIIYFLFLITGICGVFISIKNINETRRIEREEKSESAIITDEWSKNNSPSDTFYLRTQHDENVRMHLLKILDSKLNVGDRVEVKTNSERKLWLIIGYERALYGRYIADIVVFVGCFILSFFWLFVLIVLIKKRYI
jgi:large-conductance mechanosensitive channel